MEREHFYKEVSYHGNGGASGHDSVIIAYDVILGCKGVVGGGVSEGNTARRGQ
jgi:hypothetical protein